MKALVLCGGIPQIALMKYLKQKGITVVLADMNENVRNKIQIRFGSVNLQL